MSKPIGWASYETILYPFVNFNLGGATSFEEAREQVCKGTHRWVQGHAHCLKLVPTGYELDEWEHFLVETQPNRFDRV